MNQDYIVATPWAIIEEGFDKQNVCASESLFSLGNGHMGQRANFEEDYSGKTFQGSYIAGVYYPDKTRVGWWKNGYPEYFAKVLNAPNWIGIRVKVNGENLDLNKCGKIENYRRELNMRGGWYKRSFVATLPGGSQVEVGVLRFLSLQRDELGVIKYEIKPIGKAATIEFEPYIDAGIHNEDTNWEERFWEVLEVKQDGDFSYITSKTKKTGFVVSTYMHSWLESNGEVINVVGLNSRTEDTVSRKYEYRSEPGQSVTLYKLGGYVTSRNHRESDLPVAVKKVVEAALEAGFETLFKEQVSSWEQIWEMADITIDGDVKAQQGIRFNIFHLNQTYLGKDDRLNIGPKGFTGEKYGGSTYWDTEAYCIPFYMATKNQQVARALLKYRYNHLQKAIENAEKLGFTNGAALYPMVTMNGEECHNEWEITFEEIHRNGAMVFAIYNYLRYTGDYSYIPEMGLEVMIGIARFWHQRATFSTDKNKYVILGVTGPNEYENNVNNNWYTNYLAQWCIRYAIENLHRVKSEYIGDYNRIVADTKLSEEEVIAWSETAEQMYFPYSEEHKVYLQQDGFLDKELITVDQLSGSQRPINQNWSWDRILRSPYIKQADVLQGFYFFEDHFTKEKLERHFAFYEPFTVHESSLSPCVHSILAAVLGRLDQAYNFYLRTSRLDLDDYNKEVHEGLHITSMAGTWMSIVEGFGGLRVIDGHLSFNPALPEQWNGFSFKVNFRDRIVKFAVNAGDISVTLVEGQPLEVYVKGELYRLGTDNTIEL